MPETTKGGDQDISTLLEQGTRDFAKLYEKNAYLVYNLALRITCEEEIAKKATERAFMAKATPPELEADMAQAVLPEALRRAPEEPKSGGEDEMLAAVASLPPRQRAALALYALGSAGPPEIAKALDIGKDEANELLAKAREGLGAKLSKSAAEADAAYREWTWAQPPTGMWEALYHGFYSAFQAHVRGVPSKRSGGERGRLKRAAEATVGRRRGVRRLRWAIVPLLVLAGAGIAVSRYVDDGQNAGAGPGYEDFVYGSGDEGSKGKDGDKPYKPLTPEALDKLRLQELEQLKAYQKKQGDKQLSTAQRQQASAGAREIEQIARQRLAAEERAIRRAERQRTKQMEQEYARRLQEEQAKSGSGSSPTPKSDSNSGIEVDQPGSKQKTTTTTEPIGPPRTEEEAQERCLQDEDGKFVCPK